MGLSTVIYIASSVCYILEDMSFDKNKKILQKKVQEIFRNNRREGFSIFHGKKYNYIAPADREYLYQWLWDTAFHAIVLSHFDTDQAKQEIKNFLKAQREDGFLPHIIFWGNKIVLQHWAYMESKLSLRPKTTAISQPPALALAVETIYKKDKDRVFLKKVLPQLARFHRWLIKDRDPDGDGLVSVITSYESGMDELPVFQYVLGHRKSGDLKYWYYHRKPDILNLVNQFESRQILDQDYFNVEELLFNCVFIEASRALSRLFLTIGEKKESSYFAKVAKKAENSLLTKCWDEKDKIFYSLYSKDEKKAKVKTVAGLLPLFLDGLKGNQLEALVNKHLLNPKEFWTEYPVPSVAKNEPYYNPTQGLRMLWRGPTWINTNWFIVKGLRKHGLNKIADEIVQKMLKMIEKEGFREYYNPETGQGYRRKNFGWSTLILDLL